MAKFTNNEIEKIAIKRVLDYINDEKATQPKQGADIISKGRHIEVKACLKKATNLRMSEQMLDSVKKAGKWKQGSFFIYYVFDIESGNPKLMIFDYNAFKKHKVAEIKWIIQPFKIKRDTGKPDIIDLPKITNKQ